MEQENDVFRLLGMLSRPAFLVKNGIVTNANAAALSHMVNPGTPISQLLQTGNTEYAAFANGWLYLNLRLGDIPCPASVTKMEGCDLFLLDEEDTAALRCFALAGQQLRLPLTSTAGVANRFSDMAQASGDPSMIEQSGKLYRSLFQIMRIVNNMSDAFRYTLDTGSKSETRNVCAMVEEALSGSQTLLASLGTRLTYTLPDQSIYCLVDGEKLERAINNLLLNAVKYAPSGSAITAALTRKNNMLYFSVQNPAGDSIEDLKNDVFNRYLRAPGIDGCNSGIGLGMVLVRATAAAMGGTVLLEQSPEFGIRVTMTMAIRQSSGSMVSSPTIRVDYAGEWDHRLLELSELLPNDLYHKENS